MSEIEEIKELLITMVLAFQRIPTNSIITVDGRSRPLTAYEMLGPELQEMVLRWVEEQS